MNQDEKEKLIVKIQPILDRIESITKEKKELINLLKDYFPIKEGEKVNIVDQNNEHIRYAFVNKVKIELRGKEQKAMVEFDLQKCKSDGNISQHGDNLRYNEFVKKIY